MATNAALKALNAANIRNKTAVGSVTRGAIADGLDAALDYTDQQTAAVASGGKNAGKLACIQRQRGTVSAGWSTIAEVSSGNSGVITSIWIANASTPASRMRLSVDGEAVPSVFGSAGGTLAQWFCQGNGVAQPYRSDLHGVTKNGSGPNGNGFSGYVKHPIPYSDGFKLEYNPTADGETIWVMVEYTDSLSAFELPSDYRARVSVTTATPNYKDEVAFVNTTDDTVFYGVYCALASASNQFYNEGDPKGYYNGETVPSYRGSGFEDWFDSSYYFEEGTWRNTYTGIVSKEVGGNNRQTTYKFWPLLAAPRADQGLKFTYTCGDPDYSQYAPGSTSLEFVAWYYERALGSGGGGGTTPTLAKPTLTLDSADKQLTLTVSKVSGGTTYRKQRASTSSFADATDIDNSVNSVYTDTGLTNGVAYWYRARAEASGANPSPWAIATATPQLAVSPDAFFNLDPTQGVITDNGKVTQITDTIGGIVFGLANGLPGPGFVGESPSFNNRPALYFTSANNTGPVLLANNPAFAQRDTFTLYAAVQGNGTVLTNRVFNGQTQTWFTAESGAISCDNGRASWDHPDPQIICYVVTPSLVSAYDITNKLLGSFVPGTPTTSANNAELAIGAVRLATDFWQNFSAMTLGGLYAFPSARTSAQRGNDLAYYKSIFGF